MLVGVYKVQSLCPRSYTAGKNISSEVNICILQELVSIYWSNLVYTALHIQSTCLSLPPNLLICLPTNLSVYLSACLTCIPISSLPFFLFAYLPVCLSIFPPVYLSACPSINISACLSVCLFTCRLSIYISACLSVCLFTCCLSIYISACLYVCLLPCLFLCLSAYPLVPDLADPVTGVNECCRWLYGRQNQGMIYHKPSIAYNTFLLLKDFAILVLTNISRNMGFDH